MPLIIPDDELEKLLALPFNKKKTALLNLFSLSSVDVFKNELKGIYSELKKDFESDRKDKRKGIQDALRIIISNLALAVFTRVPVSIPRTPKAYTKGHFYKDHLHLTFNGTERAVELLLEKGMVEKIKGSKARKLTNAYYPTQIIQKQLIGIIYRVVEEYTEDTELVIYEDKDNNYIMRSTFLNESVSESSIQLETTYETDLKSLKRINRALANSTYAFKSPVKRIYSSNYDCPPMNGGRLYVESLLTL